MKISKTEQQQWQTESDVHILEQYEQLLNDKPRMSRAVKMAEKRASELKSRASALQNIVKGRGSKRGK